MNILPLSFDIQNKPVIVVGRGDMADAKARLVEAAGGQPLRLDEHTDRQNLPLGPTAKIAFVAVAEGQLAELWAEHLRARGLAVNVADRPDLCDFQVPAIVDRGTVSIAIATGGRSASLSKALRERLEAWLPPRLGALADAIARRRADVSRHAATIEARRAFWDRLLAPGGALDPFAEHPDPDAAITKALSGETRPAEDVLTLTLASPDPEDLTLRQLRLLQRADVILHDPAIPAPVLAPLLDKARRDAARHPLPEDSAIPTELSGVVLRLRLEM